jgi:DNA-binding LacI/PurR family transcriptional regulator
MPLRKHRLLTTKSRKIPKYQLWVEKLRRRIEAGELQPGERLPSYVEMRQQHGVTQPTMDRVHAILEQEGLIMREPGRGVFVSSTPRIGNGRSGSEAVAQGVIGCLSVAMTSARHERAHRVYWSHLMDGIEDGARKAQRQLLLFDQFSPGDAWERVDGVLTTAGQAPTMLPGIPCVSLLHYVPNVTCVLPDNAGGTLAATEYLLKLGHTRIGCLMFSDQVLSQQKIAGYEKALRQAGIAPHPSWQCSLTEPGEAHFDFMYYGEKRMAWWLQNGWIENGLTAILCENDQTAIGVIAALRKAGLDVPRDVSVIGFDGTEISKYSHPALTTVEVPLEEIGRRGVEEVVMQIEDDGTVREIVLSTRLQIRESTAPPHHQ